LFFIVLDKTSTLPIWLPGNYVRFNYADFGVEQAVGAIKARVQENGGVLTPLTVNSNTNPDQITPLPQIPWGRFPTCPPQ
jgi:hypothetical protein